MYNSGFFPPGSDIQQPVGVEPAWSPEWLAVFFNYYYLALNSNRESVYKLQLCNKASHTDFHSSLEYTADS